MGGQKWLCICAQILLTYFWTSRWLDTRKELLRWVSNRFLVEFCTVCWSWMLLWKKNSLPNSPNSKKNSIKQAILIIEIISICVKAHTKKKWRFLSTIFFKFFAWLSACFKIWNFWIILKWFLNVKVSIGVFDTIFFHFNHSAFRIFAYTQNFYEFFACVQKC